MYISTWLIIGLELYSSVRLDPKFATIFVTYLFLFRKRDIDTSNVIIVENVSAVQVFLLCCRVHFRM